MCVSAPGVFLKPAKGPLNEPLVRELSYRMLLGTNSVRSDIA